MLTATNVVWIESDMRANVNLFEQLKSRMAQENVCSLRHMLNGNNGINAIYSQDDAEKIYKIANSLGISLVIF